MEYEHQSKNGVGVMRSKANLVFIIFLIIAAFFLVTEHRAHLWGWFASYGIWLVLLACPLLHVFMHGGHGHGGHGSTEAPGESTKEKK